MFILMHFCDGTSECNKSGIGKLRHTGSHTKMRSPAIVPKAISVYSFILFLRYNWGRFRNHLTCVQLLTLHQVFLYLLPIYSSQYSGKVRWKGLNIIITIVLIHYGSHRCWEPDPSTSHIAKEYLVKLWLFVGNEGEQSWCRTKKMTL